MQIDEVLAGYMECALWSSHDDYEQPLDDNYDDSDVTDEARASMRADCEKFVSENRALVELSGMDWDHIGHNLWLSRNGHGTGFWDRGLGEVGDRLTTAAHAMGEAHLMVGDDGKLFYSNG